MFDEFHPICTVSSNSEKLRVWYTAFNGLMVTRRMIQVAVAISGFNKQCGFVFVIFLKCSYILECDFLEYYTMNFIVLCIELP